MLEIRHYNCIISIVRKALFRDPNLWPLYYQDLANSVQGNKEDNEGIRQHCWCFTVKVL